MSANIESPNRNVSYLLHFRDKLHGGAEEMTAENKHISVSPTQNFQGSVKGHYSRNLEKLILQRARVNIITSTMSSICTCTGISF